MPTYEFLCSKCQKNYALRCTIEERDDVFKCIECESDMTRLITPSWISFKGEGFYVNDSRT